ncbi:MAG: DUF2784 domain-containing protein [Nitrospiria bacterium]
MLYRIAADFIVIVHMGFILFVVFGGFLVLRWGWMCFLHLPAATWAVLIELKGLTCPLTPLEQGLRRAAGEAGYTGGFIQHYLVRIIYPEGMTPAGRTAIGVFVVALTLSIYARILYRRVHRT